MSGEHSCTGANREITFTEDGMVILRFIRLCDGQYWGGGTRGFEDLPHMTATLQFMLSKVAEFAQARVHDPATWYSLAGHGWRADISKRMEADRIAGALACTKQEVCRFFALSVEITDEVVTTP